MPTIGVNKADFYKALGKEYTTVRLSPCFHVYASSSP